ncbi:MAG: hypothetical protein ABF969_11950 [Sporolactobacillus sp.]
MSRRVVEHLRRSDGQLMRVITIFEDGINKQQARVKRQIRFEILFESD